MNFQELFKVCNGYGNYDWSLKWWLDFYILYRLANEIAPDVELKTLHDMWSHPICTMFLATVNDCRNAQEAVLRYQDNAL